MPDTSFLPKQWQGPIAALTAAATIFIAGWWGYARAESWVTESAKKTAAEEVAEIKPLIKEIHQDSKFTRCALVAHVRNQPNDLYNCDTLAMPPPAPSPNK